MCFRVLDNQGVVIWCSDHEGEHVELDLACGMFDLQDEAAIEAAERSMRAGADASPPSPMAVPAGSDEECAVHPGISEVNK